MATARPTNDRVPPVPSDTLKLNRLNSLRRRISSTSSQQKMYSRVSDRGASGGGVGIDSFYDNSEYGDFDELKYDDRGSKNADKSAEEENHSASLTGGEIVGKNCRDSSAAIPRMRTPSQKVSAVAATLTQEEEEEEDEDESIYTAMRTVASLSTKGTFDSCVSASASAKVKKLANVATDADVVDEDREEAVENFQKVAHYKHKAKDDAAAAIAESPATFSAAIDEDDDYVDNRHEDATTKAAQEAKQEDLVPQQQQNIGDEDDATIPENANANKPSSKAIAMRTLPSPATIANRRFTGTRSSKLNNISVRVNAKAKMDNAVGDASNVMDGATAGANSNVKKERLEKKKKTGSSARAKMIGAITAISGYLSDGAGGNDMDGEGTNGTRKNKKKVYRKKKKEQNTEEQEENESKVEDDKEVVGSMDLFPQDKKRQEDQMATLYGDLLDNEPEGGSVDYNLNNDTPIAPPEGNPDIDDEDDVDDDIQNQNQTSFDHLDLNNTMESIPQFTAHKNNYGDTPSKDGTECTSPASTSASERNHEDDPTSSSFPPSPKVSTKKKKKKDKAKQPSSTKESSESEKEVVSPTKESVAATGLAKPKSRRIHLLPKIIRRKSLFRRNADEKDPEETINEVHVPKSTEIELNERSPRGSLKEGISQENDACEENYGDEDSTADIDANSAIDANESMSIREASELLPKNLLPAMGLSEEEVLEVDWECQDDEVNDKDDVQPYIVRFQNADPSIAGSEDGLIDHNIVVSPVSVVEPSMEIDPNTNLPDGFPTPSHNEGFTVVSLDGLESHRDDDDSADEEEGLNGEADYEYSDEVQYDEDSEHFEVEWDFDHSQPVVVNDSFQIDESQDDTDEESQANAEGDDNRAGVEDEDDDQPSVVPNVTSMGSVNIVVNQAAPEVASEWQADFSQFYQPVKHSDGTDGNTTADNRAPRVDEISWPSEVEHANNQEVVESDFMKHVGEAESDDFEEEKELVNVEGREEVVVNKEKLSLKAKLSLKELHAASIRHAASKSVKSFRSNPSSTFGKSKREKAAKSSKHVSEDDEVPVIPKDIELSKTDTTEVETSTAKPQKLEPSKLQPKLSYTSRRRMDALLNPETARDASSIDERSDEKTLMSANESVSLNDNILGFEDLATSCTNGIRQLLDIVDYAFTSHGDDDDSESSDSSDEESGRYGKRRSRKSSTRHHSRHKSRQESRGNRRAKSRGGRISKHTKAWKSTKELQKYPKADRRNRRHSRSRSPSSSPERDDGYYRSKSRDRPLRDGSVSPVDDDISDDSDQYSAESRSPKRKTNRSTRMRSLSPVSLSLGREKWHKQETEIRETSMAREEDQNSNAARNLAKARQSALFKKTKSKKYKERSTRRSAREF